MDTQQILETLKKKDEIGRYEFTDPYLAKSKKITLLRELSHHHLISEIDNICINVFSHNYKNEENFSIEVKGDSSEEIKFINSYLLRERRSHQRSKLYPNSDTLIHFFHSIIAEILQIGFVYYAISWEELSNQDLKLILPVKFTALPPETIRFINSDELIQEYSKYGNPSYPHTKNLKTTYHQLEIFKVAYFSEIPPVKLAKDLAVKKWQYLNTDIVEKGKYTSFKKLNRERDIIDAKIRKIFHLPVESIGNLTATDVYSAYRLVNYIEYINKIREHIFEEYNKQILDRIVELNHLNSDLKLSYLNKYMTTEQAKEYFKQVKNGNLTYIEFLKKSHEF
jgi:hypothetical protein